MIAETSRIAYKQEQDTIKTQTDQVLDEIKKHSENGISDNEIADNTGISISLIPDRRGRLVSLGIVKQLGVKTSRISLKPNKCWTINQKDHYERQYQQKLGKYLSDGKISG